MKYDWHIHTGFSPCANQEMNFSAIVSAAVDAGLEALTAVEVV